VSSAEGFRIPVAADPRSRLVTPDDAAKDVLYTCPSCASPVDLHAGEKKRRHFHHRPNRACSSETIIHLAAKRLVIQAVEDWLGGHAAAPQIERTCAAPECERTTRQPFPKKVRRAVEEHRLRTGHIADVALLGPADLPVALVEIRHTHEVDDEKAFELGVPWLEVEAASISASAGLLLVPLRDRLVPWFCVDHASHRGEAKRRETLDRERMTRLSRALDYRPAAYPGYDIERITRCVNGHDAFVFTWKGKSPPDPRPPWVVARERADGWKRGLPYRRAYESVCPTCGAVLSPTEA